MKYKSQLLLVILLTIQLKAWNQEAISLQEALELSMQHNYDILLVRNIAKAYEADSRFSIGLFTPNLNASASQLWIQNDQRQTLADRTERNKNGIKSENFNSSLQLNWTLFNGTRMFVTKKKLKETAIQGNLSVKNQMVNITANVTNAYYRIVREKQQLKAILEQISISEIRKQLAEKKLEVGVGSKPELLQAKVDLNAQRSLVIEQEALILQLKEEFIGLLGKYMADDFEVEDSIPINNNLIKEDFVATIERSNPSLEVSKQNISIASLNLAEIKADKYPIIAFNSAYNFIRNNNKEVINPFSPLFTQNRGFNYGFSATLPLFRGFDIRRSIKLAQYNLQYVELAYQQEKLNVFIKAENGFTNYEKAKKILTIEEENIGLAKENIQIALERFKRGLNTFIEVRIAQFSLSDANNRLIQARFNAKFAETELLRLKGEFIK